MLNFYKLPQEIRTQIIKEISTLDLFNLIIRKAGPNQETNTTNIINADPSGSLKNFYIEVRKELFSRNNAEAHKYQNKLLISWLKHWATEKKLSFIITDGDKQEWQTLLGQIIKDPDSTYELKIRCCLFINKLSPNVDDPTPQIIEKTCAIPPENWQYSLDYCPSLISNHGLFSTEYSEVQRRQVFAWNMRLLDLNEKHSFMRSENGIAELVNQAKYYSKEQIDELFNEIIKAIKSNPFYDYHSNNEVCKIFGAFVPRCTQPQISSLLNLIMSIIKANRDEGILLVPAIIPYISNSDKVQLINLVMNNRSEPSFYDSVLSGLSHYLEETENDRIFNFLYRNESHFDMQFERFAPNATKEQINKVFIFLISKFSQKNDEQGNIFRHILRLSPFLDLEQKEIVYRLLYSVLINSQAYHYTSYEAAIAGLSIFTPQASPEQIQQIYILLKDLLIESIHERNLAFSFDWIILGVKAFAAHGSETQNAELFTFLEQAIDYRPSITSTYTIVEASIALARHSNSEQKNKIITVLYTKLNKMIPLLSSNEWNCAIVATIHAFGTFAFHCTPTQKDNILTLLGNLLNSSNPNIRDATTQALVMFAPHCTAEQLEKLILLPGAKTAGRLAFQLVAQVTQPEKYHNTQEKLVRMGALRS